MSSRIALWSAKPINNRGQSLVEIALMLPALVILFLGIAEIGFYLNAHVQVANAARAGARHGSLCRMQNQCSSLDTIIESAVLAEPQTLHLSGSNTSIQVQPNPVPIPLPVGTTITVTVVYTHTPPFISGFVPMFPAYLPIQHSVVMQISN